MRRVMKNPIIFLIAFALLASPVGPLVISAAQAEEAKKEKPKKPKTRRSQVLGKDAFRRIEKAQELMSEDKYDEAFAPLQQIIDGPKFKPYEKAVAIQTMGFVHAGKGDYPATIESFERAIATGDLPSGIVLSLTYNLAQLNLAQDRPRKALTLLEQWFAAQEDEPGADPFAFKAQAHILLNELPAAEQAIRKALLKAEEPKQQWARILLSVLLQEERYKEARPVLEDAVERWPGVKVFWQQLAAIYYEAGEEELGFVAKRAMHIQGMLTSSTELSSMAQLYLYHNVPIKAAEILQAGLDGKTIERDEKNYDLLAQAYMHAREWKKSIAPLTRAAELSDKGKFYAQLAQAHVQDEEWGKAEKALVKALNKGGLEDEANSWLLLGIARTRLEKFDAAIKAFRKAGDDDDVAKDAFRWIRSIERRLAAQRRDAEARSDG
jgi:tetratricopeptide (TPR) repeat protein